MLVVETIAKIRRAYFVQKKAVKEICRELKVSRKVVRRVVRSGTTEFVYQRKVQPQPRIGPWREELDRLLAVNAGRSSRERLTLIRVFEELRGLGYEGSYDAVRRYAARWQRERAAARAAAFVPLSFAPGEACQFDWSHEVVPIAGVTVTVKVAQVRLCHSRMLFVRAYPRESQEPQPSGSNRWRRDGFDVRRPRPGLRLLQGRLHAGHLRQRPLLRHWSERQWRPCTPASGWEKGQVENQVGTVRQRFFSPRVRVRSYEELNAWLVDRCIAWAKAQPHPEVSDRTIWRMFEGEPWSRHRSEAHGERGRVWRPTPGRSTASARRRSPIEDLLTSRFDNNKYSVMASAVGRPVEVRAYADRIELRQDGRVVGQHSRIFGRGQTVYDPWRYVSVLAHKPGALRNGAPFQDWAPPGALERVRRKRKAAPDGDRQMVEALGAVLTDGLPAVEAACAEALREGVHSADPPPLSSDQWRTMAPILNILSRRRDPGPPATIMTPEALRLRHEPAADCARYDSLEAGRADDGAERDHDHDGRAEALRHADRL